MEEINDNSYQKYFHFLALDSLYLITPVLRAIYFRTWHKNGCHSIGSWQRSHSDQLNFKKINTMDSNKKFFEVGVKYVLPLTVIAATLAMKKASGWGKLGIFVFSTPIMIFSLLSLEKARRGELFDNEGFSRMDNLSQN